MVDSHLRQFRAQFQQCEDVTVTGQRCALDSAIKLRTVSPMGTPFEGWVCGNHHRTRVHRGHTIEVLEHKS